MLNLLDEALRAFLLAEVPLSARDVDIVFEAPDGDWAAGVTRPTINLYLWEVRPNDDQAELGFVEAVGPDGRVRRESPRPRVDCRYLVTAWSSDVKDEHALLGRVLVTLLTRQELTADHLPTVLAEIRPLPSLTLHNTGATSGSDFWSALGGQLKPALDLTVTLTVDALAIREAGPPVESVQLREVGIGSGVVHEATLHPVDVPAEEPAPAPPTPRRRRRG
jgi:hypothetical protein